MTQTGKQPQDGPIKILLVEDDSNDAFLLQRALGKASLVRFDVQCAERLDAALQRLHEGRFDATLLDLTLPDSNGLDTLDAVRDANPGVPIVILSGIGDEDTAMGALQRGAQDYLVKGEASGDLIIRCLRHAIERHRTEQALRSSEERYRTLLESIPQRIFFKDRDSVFVSVNAQFAQDAGMSVEELVGKTDFDLHPKELAEKYRADDHRVMTTRQAETLEEANVVGGRNRFVEVTKAPVISDNGEVMGVLGMFTDITERRRAEEALRASEARFAGILNIAEDAIISVDEAQCIVLFNQGAERIFGYSTREALGQPLSLLLPPRFAQAHEQYVAEFGGSLEVARRMGERREISGRRKDGTEFPAEASISQLQLNEGKALTVMLRDITERKRAEKEIKTLNRELEERVVERTEQLEVINRALEAEITESTQTGAALRESEVRFHSVFENAHDAMVILDNEGLCVDANSAACELSGFPKEVLLGIPYMRFFAPDRLNDAQKLWQLFMRQGELQGGIEITRPDGETRDVEFSCKANFLPGSHLAIVYDVTDRKRAEEELRKSRDQLDVILKNVANGITVLGPGGELLFANDAAANIMGFPSAQTLVGASGIEVMSRFDILDEARQPLPLDKLPGRRALRGEEGREMLICWRVKATGDERWSIVKGTPVFDEKGQVQFVINLFLDVTERKLIEETVHVRAQQQALVAEFSQRALVGTDLSILMDEACALLAQTLNADLTKVLELLPDRDVMLMRAGVGWKEGFVGHALVSTGLESQAGYILRSRETVIVHDLCTETRFSGTPVLHEHGVVSGISVLIPGRDTPFGVLSVHTKSRRIFTEDDIRFLQAMANVLAMAVGRKRVEEEIIKLNLDLQSANKELEAFSYSVSHDLHAPLRAIAGFSDALTEEYSSVMDTQGRHYLDRIRLNAERGGRLIDDLLAFSRMGRKQMEKTNIDMTELAKSAFEDVQGNSPGHDTRLSMGALPPAHGDRAMVREVFVNLLSNSIKFTKGKEPALIEIGGRDEGNETIYYVKDNGAGFDMRFVGKLFGVFQRLHSTEEFEGTGVGLAIVQRIIHRHGGRVWAEGKVGEGAAFYFTLPK